MSKKFRLLFVLFVLVLPLMLSMVACDDDGIDAPGINDTGDDMIDVVDDADDALDVLRSINCVVITDANAEMCSQ